MTSSSFLAWILLCICFVFAKPVRSDPDCSVVSSCLINNFMVIKNLVQESSALSNQEQQSRNDSEAKIDRICQSFQPIIDCTGREAAIHCHFKIGKRGQVFRLYYLVVLCEITVKLRKCSQEWIAARSATTIPPCHQTTTLTPPTTSPGYVERSVCSQQFPDVENQTEQYRQGISTPAMPMSDDPYAPMPEATDEVEGVASALLKIGEKCDRLRLYVGCWLHYSKDMCGDQAADIIQRMYEIYNDLSGRQCSKESSELIDYGAFEEDYIKEYGRKTTTTFAPCGGESATNEISSTTEGAIVKMELAPGRASPVGGEKSDVNELVPPSRKTLKPRRTTTPMFDETYEDSELYRDGATRISNHVFTLITIAAFVHFV